MNPTNILGSVRSSIKEIYDPYPYRRYMRRHKCVFVHIPKAAGTSILSALGYSGRRDHCTYREFKSANSVRFNQYYKFAFSRDPATRFRSLYKYFLGGGNGSDDLWLQKLIADEKMDINSFASYCFENRWDVLNPMFWPQSVFVCDANRKVCVDFLGKLENIEEDFAVVKMTLGLKANLPSHNVSESSNTQFDFSESTLGEIRRVYSVDYEAFGY